jgi:hypothetical protein
MAIPFAFSSCARHFHVRIRASPVHVLGESRSHGRSPALVARRIPSFVSLRFSRNAPAPMNRAPPTGEGTGFRSGLSGAESGGLEGGRPRLPAMLREALQAGSAGKPKRNLPGRPPAEGGIRIGIRMGIRTRSRIGIRIGSRISRGRVVPPRRHEPVLRAFHGCAGSGTLGRESWVLSRGDSRQAGA